MANVSPFRALRYNPAKTGNIETVLSPPYDVIDQLAESELQELSPYNMIHLDLSKNAKAEAQTGQRYQDAADRLAAWRKSGVLIEDLQPGFYLYEIDYHLPGGQKLTRQGFMARVGLAEFAQGIVKPHEKTFAGVTGDRLRLLDACQTQFSPVFSLYSDPENQVANWLNAAKAGQEPIYTASDKEGCEHRLWVVSDTECIRKVSDFFAEQPLYIADGHHRYTTALQYRKLMEERNGRLNSDDPANHIMMYLCGMEDPGLSVLPTHRLLRLPAELAVNELLAQLSESFELNEIASGAQESLLLELFARMNEEKTCAKLATRFGLYHPGSDRCFVLDLKAGEMEKKSAEQPPALRELDVVVLSELIIDRISGLDKSRLVHGDLIDYYSDPDQALDVAIKEAREEKETSPVLFLMNPTRVAQVKAVADSGLVMPHKSTFFYPKVLTGLTLYPLATVSVNTQ